MQAKEALENRGFYLESHIFAPTNYFGKSGCISARRILRNFLCAERSLAATIVSEKTDNYGESVESRWGERNTRTRGLRQERRRRWRRRKRIRNGGGLLSEHDGEKARRYIISADTWNEKWVLINPSFLTRESLWDETRLCQGGFASR